MRFILPTFRIEEIKRQRFASVLLALTVNLVKYDFAVDSMKDSSLFSGKKVPIFSIVLIN